MDGIILVNKEKDYTSRDVVNKLTRILKTKKIGHTGTLDPIATGVLVVCVGSCTKLCDLLTSTYKEYVATIKLGIKTDTLDITGNVLEEKKVSTSKEKVEEVLNSFLGKSIQTTPIYSAVKVNGKKLYEYARNNEKVELPKREIDVKSIELIDFNEEEITFKTCVSKGTYIRAMIDDICNRLDIIGTMSSLVRTKQGEFKIDDCYTLDDIENGNYKFISIEEALNDMELIDIDDDLYSRVCNGAIIEKNFKGDVCLFRYENKIIAIYQVYDKDKSLAKPFKMFIN